MGPDTRAEYDRLYGIYAPIGIAVGIVVGGVVLLAAYRGWRRARPGARDEAPAVELLWALIVLALVGVLLGFTVRSDDKITDQVRPGLVVDVTGYEWGWSFAYPASAVVVDTAQGGTPVLGVPTGTTVQFRLHTRDVIHSFYIPDRRFKHDIFPGHDASFETRWERTGSSTGQCAEYCGLYHDRMTFTVQAKSPGDFAHWLQSRRPTA